MNTLLFVLINILCFLLWIEMMEWSYRRFLDKITEDSIKMSEETAGHIVANIKIRKELSEWVDKYTQLEKKYENLFSKQCITEKRKDEIIRLHKLGRSSAIIWAYVWVTASTIRHAIRKWKKKEPQLFRPTKFIEAISR